ncbi:MAG: Rdx family protein [Gemmatimonadetes bacterium]|nr:Rdx family protein [Gemmatimonadota bacterium]MCH7716030.1 Rdx family protein [Gemmatimonadota bacterium]
MAAELTEAYSGCDVQLIEGSGGVFEVIVDGDLVFSKKALGRHAEEGEVLRLIGERESA